MNRHKWVGFRFRAIGFRVWGYTGILGNKVETAIVNCGYIGMMEKKMETTNASLHCYESLGVMQPVNPTP